VKWGFYGHLSSYDVGMFGTFNTNLWTSPNHLWFYWPLLLGWGIEVIIHGVKVLTFIPFIGLGSSKKIKRVHGGRTGARKQNNYK
jgi:hypothetical protein